MAEQTMEEQHAPAVSDEDVEEALTGDVMDWQQQLVPLGRKFHIDIDSHSLSLNPHAAKITVLDGQNAVRNTRRVQDNLQYIQGDLYNLIESELKEESSQIVDHEETGLSASTIRNLQWVAERVAPDVRVLSPSWSHSQAVAALNPQAQRKWLERARDESWSVAKLKVELAQSDDGGRTKLRFWVLVEAGSEAKQEKLADELEKAGYTVTKRTAAKKEKKAKKKKAKALPPGKKGEVTAKRRGPSKMSSRRRPPK